MYLADIDYTKYAELLIDTGINLKKGMNLIIRFAPEGILLARRCARVAYERGAGVVELVVEDKSILKSRIDAQSGDEEALAQMPGWTTAYEDTVVDEKWGYLALMSFEQPGALAGSDQEALRFYEKNRISRMKKFRNAVTGHTIPWCVGAVPGPRWAEDVLGPGRTVEDLWETLKPMLLLDEENPSRAWKDKAALLVERCRKLDALALDSLRFTDSSTGTDLTVGLTRKALWVGGGDAGNDSMPNLPTEEVFTTPDMDRCSGTAAVTRPVEVRGTIVKGARLTFEDGVLTGFSAEEGDKALEGFVDTDPGARKLGEVALVGEDSPIAASGLNFGSILYDENASCHIALGSGYPPCLKDGETLTDDAAKRKAACNVSLVHVDFMIGSPATDVTGTDRAGRETPIIRAGRFVI